MRHGLTRYLAAGLAAGGLLTSGPMAAQTVAHAARHAHHQAAAHTIAACA
jgi:hypothetical protein